VSMWSAVLVASIVCIALKTLGYLIPAHWFEQPRPARITDLLTVALLSALVAVQTLAAGQAVAVDARVPAVLVAAGLLLLRAPFLVVVIAAAVTAALLRLWGLAA
jgi:protein-S-isoprenylcysteine O-methyltransferase Ste14